MKIFALLWSIILSFPILAQEASSLSLLQADEPAMDAQEISQLKTRKSMLTWHQYTAFATIGLMAATLGTEPPDDDEEEHGDDDEGGNNTHQLLGIGAGILYLTSASLAYFAPKPEDMPTSTNIFIHKKLIWIHAPSMALTIASGISAHFQRRNGEDLSAFSELHEVTIPITLASFGLAALFSYDWTATFLPTPDKGIACAFTTSF